MSMDLHGNGHQEEADHRQPVDFADLDREQVHAYARLVQDGAYYLYHDILNLAELSVANALEDEERPSDELDERFRDDVEAYYRSQVSGGEAR